MSVRDLFGKSIFAVAVSGVCVAPTMVAASDFGKRIEERLNARSLKWFGFDSPLRQSANTPQSMDPGDEAVEVAGRLQVKLISEEVGVDADMIALWPDSEHPTHAIICNEIDGTEAGAAASVQRVDLDSGTVSDMVFGLVSCDPARRTPWGTVIVTVQEDVPVSKQVTTIILRYGPLHLCFRRAGQKTNPMSVGYFT